MGMVQNLGWYTPLGSTLVGFMFLALDKIGRDLEDPFDNTIFDVPHGRPSARPSKPTCASCSAKPNSPLQEAAIHGVLW